MELVRSALSYPHESSISCHVLREPPQIPHVFAHDNFVTSRKKKSLAGQNFPLNVSELIGVSRALDDGPLRRWRCGGHGLEVPARRAKVSRAL